jgi:undecaprenyl-diphosphatase
MPSALQAAILGIVQGVTEFLPVSSTAHLLLGSRLLGFQDPDGVFTVMIQLGSVLAVVWLYRTKIIEVVAGLPTRPEARHFAVMILVAFLPAAVLGALLSGFVKRVLYRTLMVIAVSFIVGGIIILLVERRQKTVRVRDVDATPLGTAFGIGMCQALALVPGVSRSGGTIIGALLLGLDRPVAAEFSFFLAIPTMAAAFAHDLYEVRHSLTAARAGDIAIGFVMAFVASVAVVKPFLEFIRRSGFGPFAWYRILLGVCLVAALAAGWV